MKNFILPILATTFITNLSYGVSLNDVLSTDQADTPAVRRVLTAKGSDKQIFSYPNGSEIGRIEYTGTLTIPQGITSQSIVDRMRSRSLTLGNLNIRQSGEFSIPVYFKGLIQEAQLLVSGTTTLPHYMFSGQSLQPLMDEGHLDLDDKDMREDNWTLQKINDLPSGFDWTTVHAQLSGKPGELSPADQRNWTVRRFLQGFDTEAFSFQPGVPNGFNWRDFLEKNPALNARYLREQRISQTDLNQPEWQKKLASWLQAIVKGSITGNEAGHSWIAGLPRNFNWKTFAAQNPSVDARFRRENKLSPTGPITDPGMLARRARWLQVIAKLNMEGKDAGYSWLPGVEKGFNWKQALTSSVKSRYKREQLARTEKAKVSGEYSKTPTAYLMESDFNADNSLKPASGWLGKQAIWVQNIKKLGQI